MRIAVAQLSAGMSKPANLERITMLDDARAPGVEQVDAVDVVQARPLRAPGDGNSRRPRRCLTRRFD